MKFAALSLTALAALALVGGASFAQPPSTEGAPRYDASGKLLPVGDYRDWAFLSSGIDMSYSDAPAPAGSHSFDNVFAPAAAVAAFKRTGVWPDKTVLVVEIRTGQTKGSINKQGQYQTDRVLAVEAHVKDQARFKGGWGFFALNGEKPVALIPYTADCYSCHLQHAAADTTFVQFYPTLLPIATKLGTLSKAYLADSTPPVGK